VIPVTTSAGVVLLGALIYLATPWNAVRASLRRRRRRGMVVLQSTQIEGGLGDLILGVALIGAAVLFSVCFFTGAVVLVQWGWSLA